MVFTIAKVTKTYAQICKYEKIVWSDTVKLLVDYFSVLKTPAFEKKKTFSGNDSTDILIYWLLNWFSWINLLACSTRMSLMLTRKLITIVKIIIGGKNEMKAKKKKSIWDTSLYIMNIL